MQIKCDVAPTMVGKSDDMMWKSESGSGETCDDPRPTPKPRTPEQVWKFVHPKRHKPVCSKSSIWNCQREPHETVGVLTVPFSVQYIRGLGVLKAMESHSLKTTETATPKTVGSRRGDPESSGKPAKVNPPHQSRLRAVGGVLS